MPCDLAAYVVGKSSWGRLGLIVATAIGVHPNYKGIITLELRNIGEIPFCLRPGLTIAQMFFHTLETETSFNCRSSYATAILPESGTMIDKNELTIIDKIGNPSNGTPASTL